MGEPRLHEPMAVQEVAEYLRIKNRKGYARLTVGVALPLARERFDLLLHRRDYFDPPIQKPLGSQPSTRSPAILL